MKELVTVVIPTYNRAKYIEETIKSVIGQKYPNIEIIVIDDGSTDNTEQVVSKYRSQLTYIHQENSERGASRNHGLRLAKGKFIAFLDSDDLWLPDKISQELEMLQNNPAAGVVYSDALSIDANGRQLKTIKRKTYSGRVTEKLLENNFISMSAHLAKTDFIRKISGFVEDRNLSGSEDWEMWVRLSTITEFIYLPKTTTKIRTHSENTMSDAKAMNRSMTYALKIMKESNYLTEDQKKILPKTKAYISLINAINHCSAREKQGVFLSLKNAFVNNPKIILDPRFGYTIWRLLKQELSN